jgi:hypothetical protein
MATRDQLIDRMDREAQKATRKARADHADDDSNREESRARAFRQAVGRTNESRVARGVDMPSGRGPGL